MEVPQTILKQKIDMEKIEKELHELKRKRLTEKLEHKKSFIFQTPQKFYRMTKQMDISYRVNKRESKLGKQEWLRRCQAPGFKPRLIVVVNLSKTLPLDNVIKSIMEEFDILDKLSCKLVVENEENVTKLLSIQNQVTYGYINRKMLKDLLFKRGKQYDTDKNQFLTINDNAIIEEQLGDQDILCLEDIIEELWSLGKHVGQVLGFVARLQLDMPEAHFLKHDYTKMYKHGGEYGERCEEINLLLDQLL